MRPAQAHERARACFCEIDQRRPTIAGVRSKAGTPHTMATVVICKPNSSGPMASSATIPGRNESENDVGADPAGGPPLPPGIDDEPEPEPRW